MKASDISTGEPFIDHEIVVERTTSRDELSDENERFNLAFSMMAELFHGFGIGQPAPLSQWDLANL